ncbi:MAG: hypothetical protein LBU23_00210 [Planctomycetota bacterium]|jgi:hypothetical protein|nr:hypothetical protein [Planctomycetota bacterium]
MEFLKTGVPFIRGKYRNFTTAEVDRMLDLIDAAAERRDWGEVNLLGHILPLDPDTAMTIKRVHGKRELLKMGFDLTEADLFWGEGWLDRSDE